MMHRVDTMTPMATTRQQKDFLSLEHCSPESIIQLLDRAESMLPVVRRSEPATPVLAGSTVANIFFENSTRTRCSFEIAAGHLGARVLNLGTTGSSSSKGETMLDTVRNIEAMGVDAMVIRTDRSGGAGFVAENVQCPVINAGDGTHEHPTQGLLDLLTIRQHIGRFEGIRVAIVGDIIQSRVARSDLHGLVSLGADVVLVGPPSMVSDQFKEVACGPGSVDVSHEFDPILPELDVVIMLRVQAERGSSISEGYTEGYGLTGKRLEMLDPGCIVMHPGPLNRGVEICDEAADDQGRSVILQQVTNGVAVRMAVLSSLLERP